jgi:hypothetical protein
MLIVENMDTKQREKFESQITTVVNDSTAQRQRLAQIERERQAIIAANALKTD